MQYNQSHPYVSLKMLSKLYCTKMLDLNRIILSGFLIYHTDTFMPFTGFNRSQGFNVNPGT
jgi:hypothetical protein